MSRKFQQIKAAYESLTRRREKKVKVRWRIKYETGFIPIKKQSEHDAHEDLDMWVYRPLVRVRDLPNVVVREFESASVWIPPIIPQERKVEMQEKAEKYALESTLVSDHPSSRSTDQTESENAREQG